MQAGQPQGRFAPVVAAFLLPAVPPGKSLQSFQMGLKRFRAGQLFRCGASAASQIRLLFAYKILLPGVRIVKGRRGRICK